MARRTILRSQPVSIYDIRPAWSCGLLDAIRKPFLDPIDPYGGPWLLMRASTPEDQVRNEELVVIRKDMMEL